nr:ABC transporter permease [Clostridium sp.]
MREYSWKNKKWEILSLIFFLAIWRILSIKVNNDIYIPKIEEVIKSISTIIKEKNFGLNFSNSLIRT